MKQLRCQNCNARLFDGDEKLTVKSQKPNSTLIQIKCYNCGHLQRVYERAVITKYEMS